jgi:hypothetical protein
MGTTIAKPRKAPRTTARQKLEKLGPPRATLKKLAKRRRPPQRWFDETANPFKSSQK